FLLRAREGDAALFPQGDALLQGGVVERAPVPQDHLQRTCLCGRGPEFLLIGLAHRLQGSTPLSSSVPLVRRETAESAPGSACRPYWPERCASPETVACAAPGTRCAAGQP